MTVGYTFNGTDRDFALARYNQDGSLDTSFSNDGKVITDIGQSINESTSLALQIDGKIIAAGGAFWPDSDFALVRYNVDGSLDASFSDDGIVTTDFEGGEEFVYAVIIQSDAKIVAAGRNTVATNTDFGLARYKADGSLDNNFSGDGKVTTNFGGSLDRVEALAIQSDNKIIAVGESNAGGDYDFALARYLSSTPPGTTANNDSYSTPQDTTLNIPPPGVLSNDYDGEGDPITTVLQSTTSNGSLTLNSDGSFLYMPNTGFLGTERIALPTLQPMVRTTPTLLL